MGVLIAALVAFAMLLLYAFGIELETFNLGWMGLAVLALAIAIGAWPANFGRRA